MVPVGIRTSRVVHSICASYLVGEHVWMFISNTITSRPDCELLISLINHCLTPVEDHLASDCILLYDNYRHVAMCYVTLNSFTNTGIVGCIYDVHGTLGVEAASTTRAGIVGHVSVTLHRMAFEVIQICLSYVGPYCGEFG
jgi:hypothetical protein